MVEEEKYKEIRKVRIKGLSFGKFFVFETLSVYAIIWLPITFTLGALAKNFELMILHYLIFFFIYIFVGDERRKIKNAIAKQMLFDMTDKVKGRWE